MLTKTINRFYNKYNLVRGYRKQHLALKAYPSIVNIETSSFCNLQCPMCVREATSSINYSNMAMDLYKKVIDEISEYTDLAVLHNSGEPLMNSNLPEMVRYADKCNMGTMFSTNAALLTAELSERLINNGLSLMIIALDGVTKKVYESIRKGAEFEQVEKNILVFLEKKKALGRNNPRVILQFIEMESNKHELPQFMEKWAKHDVSLFIKPSVVHGRKINRKIESHCDRLWLQTVILSDGTVVPCCVDYNSDFALGNVNDSKLIDLLTSKKMMEIRKGNRDDPNGFSLCASCNYQPPRKHTILTDMAQCLFDMTTLARILYILGYKRKSQL